MRMRQPGEDSSALADRTACTMRRIPALHFVLDTSIEYSVHISQMLREIMPQEDAQEGSDDGDVQ